MPNINELTLAKELIKFPSVTPRDAGAIGYLSKQLKKLGFSCKILKFKEEIHVGVFESNICKEKNFVIPMIACEKAAEYISSAKILNTAHLKNDDIINFFNISTLYKTGKLTAENIVNKPRNIINLPPLFM